jgi:ComF family protein
MTSLLERTISIIAPNHCFCCSKESNVLCVACAEQVFGEGPEMCFLCNKQTLDSSVCSDCASQTALGHVWMAETYDGIVKQLVKAYKFERLRAAHEPLAAALADTLPYLPDDIIVVSVPTASSRVRRRGYDHVKLLAKRLARIQGWKYQNYLGRTNQTRQVGASRRVRFEQANQAYVYKGPDLTDKHILLVDDVTTSGATLQAAAALLQTASAATIDAVVVAKHTLDQS